MAGLTPPYGIVPDVGTAVQRLAAPGPWLTGVSGRKRHVGITSVFRRYRDGGAASARCGLTGRAVVRRWIASTLRRDTGGGAGCGRGLRREYFGPVKEQGERLAGRRPSPPLAWDAPLAKGGRPQGARPLLLLAGNTLGGEWRRRRQRGARPPLSPPRRGRPPRRAAFLLAAGCQACQRPEKPSGISRSPRPMSLMSRLPQSAMEMSISFCSTSSAFVTPASPMAPRP